MKPPTYLLAKYIPNLQRMEPRNIGVILWAPGAVHARFLFERIDKAGSVDGKRVLDWIEDLSAYKEWIKYWRSSISNSHFQPPSGGPLVSKQDEKFLPALMSSSRGNFVLVEGGFLLDGIPHDELGGACDHLFEELVEIRDPQKPRELTLDDRWQEIIERTNLRSNPLYQKDYSIKRGEEILVFSDALANGTPKSLFERVKLGKRPIDFMKNAHHAAWQFEKVIQSNIVSVDDTAAIISLSDEQEEEEAGRIASLTSVTRVWNLQKPDYIVSQLQQIVAASFAHQKEEPVNTQTIFLKE